MIRVKVFSSECVEELVNQASPNEFESPACRRGEARSTFSRSIIGNNSVSQVMKSFFKEHQLVAFGILLVEIGQRSPEIKGVAVQGPTKGSAYEQVPTRGEQTKKIV